ncbi:MAG: CbiQ family ECF transporter T component [bacterium]|nr:CbiQ family ECF transporter T component [bacterium]
MSGRTRHDPVSRGLAAIEGVTVRLAQESDRAAVEPRCAVISLIWLILTATLIHSPLKLLLMGVLLLAAAGVLRADLRYLAPVWRAAAIVAALLAFPSIFNLITPGSDLMRIIDIPAGWRSLHPNLTVLTVTAEGLTVASRFFLRVIVCLITSGIILSLQTPRKLMAGLRGLGVPALFISVMALMYRYLIVLLRYAAELHRARLSRSPARGGIVSDGKWASVSMGIMFKRSFRLAEDMHMAMLSRGVATDEYRFVPASAGPVTGDYLFVGCSLLLGALLLLI